MYPIKSSINHLELKFQSKQKVSDIEKLALSIERKLYFMYSVGKFVFWVNKNNHILYIQEQQSTLAYREYRIYLDTYTPTIFFPASCI